ncbi:MAG: heparinase II/III family protein [Phycisphaerae bacterium]|nr:heparinase II/III family protein [Phycisphaerae bacterium]
MKKLFIVVLLFACNCWAADVLDGLKTEHPRLLMNNSRLAELKGLAKDDKVLARYVNDVIKQADGVMNKKPLQRILIGPRLLNVSRDCLDRVYDLAFAYRWTGKKAYADKAIENMLTVSEFQDWNPSHFLDVAEMTHALAIGYDWLYDVMSAQERKTIRQAIVDLGLKPGLDCYNGKGWWHKNKFNWNQVCNGGLTIGALAIAEDETELSRIIIDNAVKSLPLALKSYEPDGLWMEGPGYWHYATRYTVAMLASLDTALGHDFNLSQSKAMEKTVRFPIQTTGPINYMLNYADSGKARRNPMGCVLWLAKHYDDKFAANNEHELLESGRAEVGHVLWYWKPKVDKNQQLDLDAFFAGDVALAVFRSAWKDKNALFTGIKAGYNQVAHGHLDLGTFELTALGVQWAIDLGSDDYNLLSYWDMRQGGGRWKYYRLNSLSHNVPIIDNENQLVAGKAKFIKFSGNTSEPYAIVDLTSAYKNKASKVIRTLKLTDNRKAITVKDDYSLSGQSSLRWQMTTPAKITLNGKKAVLTQNGKTLVATILQPANAIFSELSTKQKLPQKNNKGTTQLAVQLENVKGDTVIEVKLEPQF